MNVVINRMNTPHRTDGVVPHRAARRLTARVSAVAAAIIAALDARVPF